MIHGPYNVVKLSLRKGHQAVIFIETNSHERQGACIRSSQWSPKEITAEGHGKHEEFPPLRDIRPNPVLGIRSWNTGALVSKHATETAGPFSTK